MEAFTTTATATTADTDSATAAVPGSSATARLHTADATTIYPPCIRRHKEGTPKA